MDSTVIKLVSIMKHDKDSIIQRAKKAREIASDADKHNREEMIDDLRFAALDQWPEEVKRERKNRPMLTLDRTNQAVRQVTGDMQMNRPSIKVLPVDSEADKDTANVIESLVREIEYRSQASHVYMNAARYQVKCGYGVFRVGTDYTTHDAFEQDITILPVDNPLNWWFDPLAIQPSKHDGNFVIGICKLHKDDFEKKYPKAVPDNWDNIFEGEDKTNWVNDDYVIIAEYFEKVPVKKEIVYLSDGRTIEIDEITDQDKIILAQNGVEILNQRSAESYEIHYHKLTSFDVLETTVLKTRYFPIIPVYGEVENIEGTTYIRGMIRAAKDPQRLYNYWSSQAAETIALQPKAPFIATAKQLKNFRQMWDQANTSNLPYLLYEPDDKAPMPQRQAPPSMQGGLLQQASVAAEDIKAATGIYDAALGQRSNETSGRAIIARQQEADISNSHFMMNLAAAIEQCGRVIVDMIPHYYDTQRIISIRGEDGSERMEAINEPVFTPQGPVIRNNLTRGKYDVRVQVGPSYKTRRIEAANSLADLVAAFPEMRQLAGDLVVKNLDLPGAEELEARLKKMLPPGMDDKEMTEEEMIEQQQAMQQQQALEQAMLKMQMDSQQAKIQKDMASAQKDMAYAEKQLSSINKDMADTAKTVAEAEGQSLENMQTSDRMQREQAIRALLQAAALLNQPYGQA